MKHLFLKLGYTVATVGTGILLTACGSQADAELSATSPATVRLALVSVPSDVVCVRALVKSPSRSVTRDFNVSPGKPSNFTISGLPAGQVSFDMDAYSVPCGKLGKETLPSWVGDSQSVFLTNGAVTRVSVTLRPNAAADVTADFVPDTGGPVPGGSLQFSPPFFDFGAVAVGSFAVADLKLVNNSDVPTPPVFVALRMEPDVSVNASDCAKPLAPKAVCFVKLTFKPSSSKFFTAELLAVAGPAQASAKISGSGFSAFPPSELVGHWSFNAVKGSLVPDDSGKGNVGEVVQGVVPNAPTVSAVVVPGKVGQAIDLSPKDTWVRVKNSPSIDATGTTSTVTMAAWVKPGAISPMGFQWAISRNEVGTSIKHFGLGLQGGKPTVAVHFFFATAPESVIPGQWSHLAGTYDGITQSVFVNGTFATSSDIGWPIASDTTDTIIGAGQSNDTIKEFFAGSLDEVRLYNGSLSAAEVKNLVQ